MGVLTSLLLLLLHESGYDHFGAVKWWHREYLEALLQYLQSFHARTQPLQSISKQLGKLEAEFAAEWKAGTVPGWAEAGEAGAAGEGGQTISGGAIDVEAFDSVEELEQLGAPPSSRRQCRS